MPDGEVNVSVRAEGVDDAAGELDGAAAAGAGDDGGGGGLGGVSGSGKSSEIGKLLTRIAALVVFLGPILDVLGSITNVLTAFVAPLAVMLMRLLQPVLGFMIKLLPMWLSLTDTVDSMIENLSVLGKVAGLLGIIAGAFGGAKIGAVVGSLIGGFIGSVVPGIGTAVGGAIGAKVGAFVGGIVGGITGGITLAAVGEFVDTAVGRLGDVVDGVSDLPSRIWSFMERLPGLIGDAVSDVLPDLPGTGAADTARDTGRRFDEATGGRLSDARDTVVNIGGGLTPFVEEITKNGSFDFP